MNYLLTLLLFLTAPGLLAQSTQYQIRGQLTTAGTDQYAYLQHNYEGRIVTDSIHLQDGTFSFSGAVEKPTRATFYLVKTGVNVKSTGGLTIYLEPGTISIQGTSSLETIIVGGTPLNEDGQRLRSQLSETNQELSLLTKKSMTATAAQQNDPAYLDSLLADLQRIKNKQKPILGEFVQANPASLVSLDALQLYLKTEADYAEVAPLFDRLSPSVSQSELGRDYLVKLRSLKKIALGATAPDFAQADTSGRLVYLRDFKGKYVLIDFWASWCAPCRVENPDLVKTFTQYQAHGFTILGVSLDRSRPAWLKAIQADNLSWTHVSDLGFWKNAVAILYEVHAIPHNFLLNPDGIIVAKNIRGADLSEKLQELIGHKP